jgi:hypothetical protein
MYRAKSHYKYRSIVPINATDIYILIYLIRSQLEACYSHRCQGQEIVQIKMPKAKQFKLNEQNSYI